MRAIFFLTIFAVLILCSNLSAQYDTIRCSSSFVIDSISIIDQNSDLSRFIFTYNNAYNFTSVLEISKPYDNWINEYNYAFSYNEKGLTSESIFQSWTSGAWKNTTRHQFIYNTRNQLVEDTIYAWVNDNNWFHSSLYSYTYNDTSSLNFGLITSTRLRNWGGTDWVNNILECYTYDSLGRMDSLVYKRWTNNAWKNETLRHYTYDTLGRIQVFEFYEWNGTNWRSSSRNRYSYNNYGLLGEMYSDFWYSTSGWVTTEVTNNHYNTEMLLIESIRTPLVNVPISNFYRATYTYVNNLLTSALNEYKKGSDLTWTPNGRSTFTYENGFLRTNYDEKYINGEWQPYYISRDIADPVNNSIPFYSSYLSIKSHTAAGVDENTANVNNFSISQNYPNPFNPATRIQYRLPKAGRVKISIYSLTGQLICELLNQNNEAGEHEAEFRAPNLASGVYFYTIYVTSKDGKSTYMDSKKMVLVK